MKTRKLISLAAVLTMGAFFVTSARADWNEGDPFKMHYPQLPDPFGWDVRVDTVSPPPPAAVADDWLCTETGPVSDIHIWFSFQGDHPFVPGQIAFSIWSDVPDPDGPGPLYSQPGALLWSQIFNPIQYTIRVYDTGQQGWMDPNSFIVFPNDHTNIWQLNLENIPNPLTQTNGTIYWLGVNFEPTSWGEVGWKTSTNHFNDDAVWWDFNQNQWIELLDPLSGESMDMAFVITTIPEPNPVVLLGLGGACLAVWSWRRRMTRG